MLSIPHAVNDPRVIDVAEATDADAADWDEALGRLPDASYYHRFAWRRINRDALGQTPHFLLAREQGKVTGLLPLTLVSSRLFGRILCSAPFVNFGGPCAVDAVVESALLTRARELGRCLSADRIELRCWRPVDCGVDAATHKVSMVVKLPGDAEALLATFTAKHRKHLRRAQKNGLDVEVGGAQLLGEFYEVLERSWRDLGTPLYRPEYFQCILEAMPSDTRLFICRHRGQAVAAALDGEFRGRGEGLWNGVRPEARALQANYVLYWAILKDACERGLAAFNLGRSTADSGGEEFKRRWNAERHPLHFYAWSPRGRSMPDLRVDNPKFRLAIAAWRHMPLGLTRRIGPSLARCIP